MFVFIELVVDLRHICFQVCNLGLILLTLLLMSLLHCDHTFIHSIFMRLGFFTWVAICCLVHPRAIRGPKTELLIIVALICHCVILCGLTDTVDIPWYARITIHLVAKRLNISGVWHRLTTFRLVKHWSGDSVVKLHISMVWLIINAAGWLAPVLFEGPQRHGFFLIYHTQLRIQQVRLRLIVQCRCCAAKFI